MDLWLVGVLYAVGIGLLVAEALMPGIVMGILGAGALVTSVIFGFKYHWGLAAGQIALALGVVPVAFVLGLKRVSLKTSLGEGASNGQALVGREGETQMDLRPAGMVTIDGRKFDVVTTGERVDRGKRVRVVKVEGNRIVVREIS
jgi:membrane-bound serine protease (ClpP class)